MDYKEAERIAELIRNDIERLGEIESSKVTTTDDTGIVYDDEENELELASPYLLIAYDLAEAYRWHRGLNDDFGIEMPEKFNIEVRLPSGEVKTLSYTLAKIEAALK